MVSDLNTLLLVRFGVDFLIAVAFWGQVRRYPAIGGPGWWALGAMLSIFGSVALMARAAGAGSVAGVLAAMLLFMSHACAWAGLRRYLRLSMPWLVLGLMLVTMLGLQLAIVWAAGGPEHRQSVYALSTLALALLVVRDLLRQRARRFPPEYRALILVTATEGLVLLLMAGWMLTNRPTLTGAATTNFILFFLMTKLLRALLFSALVSLRLRQDAEQARQHMVERETESLALVDHLGAGVVVFRPDRSVVRANAAARRFLGWPADGPLPNVKGWRLLRPDGQPVLESERPFLHVLTTGQPLSDFVRGIRVGGEVRWGLCNVYPDNDLQGGLRHVVFTFVDITILRKMEQQQRTLEQQLALSQKMEALGTLAGGVAHDFNNILAAILGNADLARQDLQTGSPASESLHEISRAARRGRELVRQILAFSRQQPLARTEVCLRDMVAETCSLLRTAITPQIQLVVDVAGDTPAIRADATQLGQVLLNLGTNAIHALEGRAGRIEYRVEAVRRGDRRLPEEVAQFCEESDVDAVCVSVSDDGCGMSPATRERMFEPFFTTKAVGSGTGLGLPVVLGIVQAHGGAIEVDSTPDQGTRFRLYFPAATALGASSAPTEAPLPPAPLPGTILGTVTPAASPAAPAAEEPIEMAEESTAAPRHILYLDDDDTLVFLVRRLLERRGYKVTAFTDQDRAIEAVRQQPDAFHLVMTDFNMPGMSGLDVARAVLAINPGLPVAVASGYITDELQEAALAAGVREVVFKTDAVEAFCEIVARLVTPPRPA